MPTERPPTLEFRTLHAGGAVAVREYVCRACRGGPAAEESSDGDHVVILRRGAFCRHFGRRTFIADVNQATFFARGTSYRVSHPADCGDRGVILAPERQLLEGILRDLDRDGADRESRGIPFASGPLDRSLFARNRDLIRGLETSAFEPLEIEVRALELVGATIEAAYARHSAPRRRRAAVDRDHGEKVEAAKEYLARHRSGRVALADVARAAHSSPYHFARMFARHTGLPVHRYLIRLRLRAAVERLAGGERELAGLALELGFASHSHFTDSFRREFGKTPSSLRGLRRAV
jgi:AraC-like DNA-binding protein